MSHCPECNVQLPMHLFCCPLLPTETEDFFSGFEPRTIKIDPIGPTAALKAHIETLEAALRKIRVDCFDDSEWAQIIDLALSGKP